MDKMHQHIFKILSVANDFVFATWAHFLYICPMSQTFKEITEQILAIKELIFDTVLL